MGKKNQKNIRNLREQKAKKIQRRRKKNRLEKPKVTSKEPQKLTKAIILQKNALPVSVLVIGCFLFSISTQASSEIPLFITDSSLPQNSNSTENYFDNSSINRTVSKTKIAYSITETPATTLTYTPPTEAAFVSAVNTKVVNIVDSKYKKITPIKDEVVETKAKVTIKSTQASTQKTPKTISFAKTDASTNSQHLKTEISNIVKDMPMKAMVDDIIKRKPAVAAFLLGIGMKESKYGTYSPKKDGAECFNYWGYRGRENTTDSGYSCFDSPSHAIQVVGDRIEALINQGLDTPAKMIVWKCGSTCAGHSDESVDKWIADVSINYYRLNSNRLLSKK